MVSSELAKSGDVVGCHVACQVTGLRSQHCEWCWTGLNILYIYSVPLDADAVQTIKPLRKSEFSIWSRANSVKEIILPYVTHYAVCCVLR